MRFDPARHAASMKNLRDAAGGFKDRIENLAEASDHLGAQWSGVSQESYAGTHAAWSSSMTDQHDALEKAIRAAERAGARLVQAETSVIALWS